MSSTGSFIPQNPAASNRPSRKVRKIYIVTYIIYIFFGVTLITSLGIFAYTQYLGSQINTAKSELVALQENFDADLLTEIQQFEARLNQANSVFDGHVSLYRVLTAVEEIVLQDVALAGLAYSDSDDALVLRMSAQLPDFNAAVYQREVLDNHELFKTATVENISYSIAGTESGTSAGGEAAAATGGSAASDGLTFDIIVPLEASELTPLPPTAAPETGFSTTTPMSDDTTSTVATGTQATGNNI